MLKTNKSETDKFILDEFIAELRSGGVTQSYITKKLSLLSARILKRR
jgi:predicted metal-dependent phosphotriesterase family hydrolase